MKAILLQRGELGRTYEPDLDWNTRALSPAPGSTHGGLVYSREGLIYCSTDGPRSVILFNMDGSVEGQFDGSLAGIHAMTLVEDAGEEFMLCAHLTANRVVKLDMRGRVLWTLGCPMASGLYANPTDFKPTAVVQSPDGRLFVADGYGASVIHVFDSDRRYLDSFGGAEAGPGRLCNCHGMSLDTRGGEPKLLICDRRNRRLIHYSLEGQFLGTVLQDLRRPCSVAFGKGLLAIAELEGRVLLLDEETKRTATVGDNPDSAQWADYMLPSNRWNSSRFNAPHAVCFDADRNLYVQEWNCEGRITRWRPA